MNGALPIAIGFLLTGLTTVTILYHLFSLWVVNRFFSQTPARHAGKELRPATIMVPLCGADPGAYENYATLCQQDYSEYQIVFGVRDARDASVPIINKIIADFPQREVAFVVGPELIGQNFKASNLQNMLSCVKHPFIVIVDSDVRVRRDFLRQVIPPLNEDRVGLVTCLYRPTETPNIVAALEAIGITSEFQPGVLVARALGGMRFALGASMATKRKLLDSVGGFPAIADYLADDYMLGHLIWKAGYEVRLSHYIVETGPGHTGWLPMVKHQLRLARGIRACRPWSHFGLIATHGTAWAFLNLLLSRGSGFSFVLLASVLIVRLIAAWHIGVRRLADRVLRKYFWLLPIRDLLSFVIWSSALVSRKVEWRGKTFRIVSGGKMVQDR